MALTVEATKLKFALGALVEVASKHHRTEFEAPVKLRSSNAMHTDRLSAHSLLMWILATAKQEHDKLGALRNSQVTTMPSTAHVEYLSLQAACKRRPRVVALKGVLVEEYSVVVLRDHVEVLCQRLVGDKTCPFLRPDHGPLR